MVFCALQKSEFGNVFIHGIKIIYFTQSYNYNKSLQKALPETTQVSPLSPSLIAIRGVKIIHIHYSGRRIQKVFKRISEVLPQGSR